MEKINFLRFKIVKLVFYDKNYLIYEYIEGNKLIIDDIDLVVKEF